jgi:hypothetical protein
LIKRLLEKWFNLEPEVCYNCEFLKTALEQERREKNELLRFFMEKKTEVVPVAIPQSPQPIPSGRVPWNVMKGQLERADALRAANERQNKVAELEKELDVNEG